MCVLHNVSFLCFFLWKQCDNFEMDQAGMKVQLSQIHKLMQFVDPELCSYLGSWNYIQIKCREITETSHYQIPRVFCQRYAWHSYTCIYIFLNFSESHDSGNFYFCFRWLLILFKREFSFNDIMRFWEVRIYILFHRTHLPSFHFI